MCSLGGQYVHVGAEDSHGACLTITGFPGFPNPGVSLQKTEPNLQGIQFGDTPRDVRLATLSQRWSYKQC